MSDRNGFWTALNATLQRNGHEPAHGGELSRCLPLTNVDEVAARVVAGRERVSERSAKPS